MKKFLTFIVFLLSISSASAQFYPGGFGGSEMPLWLLPNQAITNTGTNASVDGDDVAVWRDNGFALGGSNDATPETNAPSYNSTAPPALLFGNPSVVFDRANSEWLQIPDEASINGNIHNEKMMTVTFRTNSVTHARQVIYEEGGTTNGMSIYLLQNVLYVAIWNYGGTNWGGVPGSTVFPGGATGEDYRLFTNTSITTIPTIVPGTDYLVTLLYDNLYTNTFRGFLNGLPMGIQDGATLRTSLPVNTLDPHTGDIGIGAVNDNSKIYDIAAGNDVDINATGEYFDGTIGEITYYNSAKNTERKIVENYFATKYPSLTLVGDMFVNPAPFNRQMIGIGREATSGSLVNTDRVDANIQSSGGLFLSNDNYLNESGDYVFAAHNGAVGTINTQLAPSVARRANREWYVQRTGNTNTTGNVTLSFDVNALLNVFACRTNENLYQLWIDGAVSGFSGTYNPNGTVGFTIPADALANALGNGRRVTVGVDNIPIIPEICDNGCDDDGDGFEDCNDLADCSGTTACEDFFFGQPPLDCAVPPATFPDTTPEEELETDDLTFEIEQRGGVFVGDMVPDDWLGYDPLGLSAAQQAHAEIVTKNPYSTNYTSGPRGPRPGVPLGDPREPTIYIYPGEPINTVDDQVVPIQSIRTVESDKFSMVAIGDVDRNGNGDVFLTGIDRRIYRYEFDESLAFGAQQPGPNAHEAASTALVQSTEMSPALADFNQDGRVEVYVGNAIFDAEGDGGIPSILTNYIPANPALSAGIHPNDGSNAAFPVAYDVFSPTDINPTTGAVCGGLCSGLELVTGNAVYGVDLLGGTLELISAAPSTAPFPVSDGRVSIADMDGDGNLEIITVGAIGNNANVFVWNPVTQALLLDPFQLSNGGQNTRIGGRANLADIDNDGDLEIVVGGLNRLYALEAVNDVSGNFLGAISNRWIRTVVETSERTSGSTFDFNGDGEVEVIYSDENSYIVYQGSTGNVLSSTPSPSGTRSEYPLVADVDKDGSSEVIITSQDAPGPDDNRIGRVTVYGPSSGNVWAASRPVWNQHTYHITNVNDDLTIPGTQTSHISVSSFNSFIKQAPSSDSDNSILSPAPNLEIGPISAASTGPNGTIDYSQCEASGNLIVNVEISNSGDADLPASTPISFFNGDPFNTSPTATILDVLPVGQTVAPGEIVIISFPVNVGGGNLDLYVLGNVDANALASATPTPTVVPYANSGPDADEIFTNQECTYSFNPPDVNIGPCLLPVELISFYADNLAEKVAVHWTTVSEQDNDYFLVERAGEDLQFQAIGRVEGKGTVSGRNDYLFNDYEPLSGTSYYRLRQIDFDGTWSLTRVVAVTRIGNSLPPSLYPNPNRAGGELFLRGLVDAQMVDRLMITSMTGQVIRENMPMQATSEGIKIQVPQKLSRGVYILNVVTDFGAENFKFVIE